MRAEQLKIPTPQTLQRFDAMCFTSNGIVRPNGALVMGAGIAKAFRDYNYFEDLDHAAGEMVKLWGNRCQVIMEALMFGGHACAIVAFPTKQDWRNPSDLNLIIRSAHELMELIDHNGWREVALPRPGCTNGGLEWDTVRAALEPILDDRVVIVTAPEAHHG